MEEGDDASSRGLSALDSSVSGLSGLARVPVMGLNEQGGAASLGGSAGGDTNNVGNVNGGIGTVDGNGADRGNGTVNLPMAVPANGGTGTVPPGIANVGIDDGGDGTAFDEEDDGIGNAEHDRPDAGIEAMHASPSITSGVPFDGLNEELLPALEGCDPPSWMLIRKEVRYRYRKMLYRGITNAIIVCSRRQDPIPWSHLDIDGLLIEGPTDMLLSLLSPMAVDLCHWTHQPDWQRGDGNWTAVVSGTRSPNAHRCRDTDTPITGDGCFSRYRYRPGVVKVFVEYKHRPNIIELLNKPTEAEERHRFMFYADSKFSLVKKPATCSREDLMTALRSAQVELVRVQCYGQKARCVTGTAIYSLRYEYRPMISSLPIPQVFWVWQCMATTACACFP